MATEDACSAENERLWSTSTLQQQWEEEERVSAQEQRVSERVSEEHARLAYMDAFYSSESSGAVMSYAWPTRPTLTVPLTHALTHTGITTITITITITTSLGH